MTFLQSRTTNPNKAKTNPVLSAAEWANFKPGTGYRDNLLDLLVRI